MPHLAPQFHLHLTQPADHKDYFKITGTRGNIHVEAATIPTLLYGVNWYLKYTAHLTISPNGLQLGPPNLTLPAPAAPIEQPALYPIRYALNENTDGYTTPYWDEARWRHEIDILALSGINAMIVERGMDMVLYQTFLDFGFTDDQIRHWITQPAHQNWQLMGNMCCFNEPISLELLQKRAASGRRIAGMLRELGISPVFQGYYGIVPAGFDKLNPGAHVVPQGTWNGFPRPGWLDPRDPIFAKVAASFYKHETEIYGGEKEESSSSLAIYDTELFQEGGTPGDVPEGEAVKAVQKALLTAHPNALWMILAWAKQPGEAVLANADPNHLLIADIEQGRVPRNNRDEEFRGARWLFGGLWEFGGRTTFGAPLYDYAVRLPQLAARPNSRIAGIAYFTEGIDHNPFAYDLYTEMAWHKLPVYLDPWAAEYARRRYGSVNGQADPHADRHAERAWQILARTAYGFRADGDTRFGDRDAAHDSLFASQPSLEAKSGANWAQHEARYNLDDFKPALTELLSVAPELRNTETYRYDLVDITRQVLANESRRLLPLIKQAYDSGKQAEFAALTTEWLRDMDLSDQILSTNEFFLLGRWLSRVPAWSSSPEELSRLNYDARSILTTWGERTASTTGGLHEYGNKDWSGLISSYYKPRWQMYFDSLAKAMQTHTQPEPIDWYAIGDKWNHSTEPYPATPQGDPYAAASAIAKTLHLEPKQ
jgi:alpha-N-acetylglucosaminidase